MSIQINTYHPLHKSFLVPSAIPLLEGGRGGSRDCGGGGGGGGGGSCGEGCKGGGRLSYQPNKLSFPHHTQIPLGLFSYQSKALCSVLRS